MMFYFSPQKKFSSVRVKIFTPLLKHVKTFAIPSLEDVFSLDVIVPSNDLMGIALKNTREIFTNIRRKKPLFLLYKHSFPEKKILTEFL
jgi:hypothetical protein